MKINLPLTKEVTKNLKAGDIVELSGIIYTARDAAHKRLIERLDANEPLPFDLKDSIIYYVGPTPEKPGARHWIGRSDDKLSNGCLRTDPFRFRIKRNDR